MSETIYRAIAVAQQQQPDLLLESYRHLAWSKPTTEAAFVMGLSTELQTCATIQELMHCIETVLQSRFSSQFFADPAHHTLMERLTYLVQATAAYQVSSNLSDPFAVAGHPIELFQDGAQNQAALLLDATHLSIQQEEELFLAAICHYPIELKIAVGNWGRLSRQESRFHRRGYQMIHVPPEEGNVAAIMTWFGISWLMNHPGVREVCLCAPCDTLAELGKTLAWRGITVYQVYLANGLLTVRDGESGKLITYVPENGTITSGTMLTERLTDIIHDLTQGIPDSTIPIGTLGSRFKQRYGQSVTDVLQSLNLGQPYLKFLQSCDRFHLHQENGGWHIGNAYQTPQTR